MELDFYGANKGHKVVSRPVENPDDRTYVKELNYENGILKPKPQNIPSKVGVWKLENCSGSMGNEFLHYTRSNPYMHCMVYKVKNGYRISIGISCPAGAEICHTIVSDLNTAYKYMKAHDMAR